VLLVDDDQADVVQRREHGRTGADDDVDVTAPDALPLVVALTVGEATVLDRDAFAERVAEEEGRDRGQGDFGNEHQHATVRCARGGREADVDLRLAAAGDAVKEGDLKPARIEQET